MFTYISIEEFADGVVKNNKDTNRKELIASLEKRYPDLKQKFFGSLQRYPLYGWNLEQTEK